MSCDECDAELTNGTCRFCQRFQREFHSQEKRAWDQFIKRLRTQLASNRYTQAGYYEREHATKLRAMT